MRRNDHGRHALDNLRRGRALLWRGRALKLALVSTALVTAIAAAQMATKPDDDAMSRAITHQQVAAGQAVKKPGAAGRQDKALTPDQMLVATASYEVDMRQAIAHGEVMRVSAYRSKDIIRMTCVDEKLGQMKQVVNIAQSRFSSIKETTGDEFQMRSQFTVVREGWERVKVLADEMENCMGDSLDAVAVGQLNEEGNGPNASVTDPTQPPAPTFVLDRPGYASPYR